MKAKTWLSPIASTREVIEKKTSTRVHGWEVCVFVDVLLIKQTITQLAHGVRKCDNASWGARLWPPVS